jgi:hypothetical protein
MLLSKEDERRKTSQNQKVQDFFSFLLRDKKNQIKFS